MADKRISQLIERVDIANNDVLPIVASGATTTNKVTISTIQDWMQSNLDVGVTSVGLTMPSAFQVSGSPITTSGNINVTATGTASQYIRGDGTLADFPQGGGGGGASVSYYLNGSVSQGTIGGVAYLEMNKTPVLGAGTDFNISADGYIASFITDAGDPSLLEIPAGNWNFETYFQASSGGGTPSFYIELYKVSGATATLIASNSGNPELIAFGTSTTPYFSALAVPQTTLTLTDRLAIRIYVVASGRTITLHTENSNLCQIITTFTTGLTALNGLTAQVQNFATGTSGTDFNISSTVSIHTFNLPDASASNRGAVTTGSQVFGGVKTFANGLSLSAVGGSNQVTRIVNIGTLHEGTASLNQIGFNSGNNIYFGKGLNNGGVISWNNAAVRYYTLPDADGTIALTSDLGNYIQGVGTTDSIPKFTAARTLANSAIRDTTSTVIISKNVSVDNGASQAINLTPASSGTTNRIETTGTLPLAIITSGASITLAAGGVTPQITLASSGAVTLTGALNGTSASFTGAATAGAILTNGSSGVAGQEAIRINNDNGYIGFFNSANSTRSGYLQGNTTDLTLTTSLSTPLILGTNNTPRLTISSTGAATFSSSVTAPIFSTNNGSFSQGGFWGTIITAGTGSFANFALLDAATNGIMYNPTGTLNMVFTGSITASQLLASSSSNAAIITSTGTTGYGLVASGSSGGARDIFLAGQSGFSNGFTVQYTGTQMRYGFQNGSVGIGTGSPNTTYVLDVLANNSVYNTRFHQPSSSTSAYNSIIISGAMTGAIGYMGVGGSATGNTSFRDSVVVGSQSSHPLVLNTNDTERMRITSGGDVIIGKSSFTSNSLRVDGNGILSNSRGGTGTNSHCNFFNDNGLVGSITTSGSSTSYNTSSDYRLKENVKPVENALSVLTQLKPCTFNFIADADEEVMGFIAHEVQEVIPQAVIGQKDEVRIEQVEVSPAELDEECNVITEAVIEEKEVPVYQGIDHSKLVPLLVAAIQEQQEQIKSLTEQVEALKYQING